MHLKYFKQQVNHFAFFLTITVAACPAGSYWALGVNSGDSASVTIGNRAVNCMGRVLIKTFRKMWQRREIPAGLSVPSTAAPFPDTATHPHLRCQF